MSFTRSSPSSQGNSMSWPKLMWGVDLNMTIHARVVGIAWGKWSFYVVLSEEVG